MSPITKSYLDVCFDTAFTDDGASNLYAEWEGRGEMGERRECPPSLLQRTNPEDPNLTGCLALVR